IAAVHPCLDRNEANTSGAILAEFNERRTEQVEGLAIPKIHLHNPPAADNAHIPFVLRSGWEYPPGPISPAVEKQANPVPGGNPARRSHSTWTRRRPSGIE